MDEMYWHLFPQGTRNCTMERSFLGDTDPSWLCGSCRNPKRDAQNVDVWIQERRLNSRYPITFVWGYGVTIVFRGLIEAIGEELFMRSAYLGEVRNDKGDLIEDWKTVRMQSSLIVRGSKEAGYRICQECGRIVYSAMGKRYLCPKPTNGVEIHQSDLAGLIISPQYFNDRIRTTWPKLGIERLPVHQKAMDGLPDVL